MHYIRYDVLYQAVLERLQYWAKAVQQDEEKVLNKIQKAGNAERIREKKKKASALKKAENRQNEIEHFFVNNRFVGIFYSKPFTFGLTHFFLALE